MTRTFGLRAAVTLLVLIAMAPVFVVVVQASLAEQQSRLARAEAGLRAVVDLGAAQQESLVEGARQMLAAIAYSPPVYGGDVHECASYMRKLQQHYPAAYGTFGLLDPQGYLTCRASAPPITVNSSDRAFFRTAIETGRFTVGEYTVSRASGKPVLTFGLPVYGEDGRTLRGVTYLALDVAQADAQLRRVSLAPETTLMVSDRDGNVLASAGPRAIAVGSKLPESQLQRAVAAGTASFERGIGADGNEWLFAIRPVGRQGDRMLYVAGLASRADILAPSAARLRAQLVALAVILLAGGLTAFFFGELVVARPIRRVLRSVDALAGETFQLDSSRPVARLHEIVQLDERLNEVARRLTERAILRDAAMAEVAQQRNLLESVFDRMAEGVLVVNQQGRLLQVNGAGRQILEGLPALGRRDEFAHASPEALGVFLLDGKTPCPAGERPLARAIAGESVDDFRFVLRGVLTGGREKVIRGSARPLTGPEGERAGAVVVFFDITAAWRAEQDLRKSEARYRTLFEANPHPMWVFERESLRFLTVNDAAVAHYGYSRDEFLAMRITDIRPVEDVPAMLESMAEGDTLSTPRGWRHRLKDGQLIWVEISSHSLDYDGRPARMVLAHDVTKLLEAQQALEDANASLERRVEERTRELNLANRELESFAYSVSHDLRAPLAAIDGFGRALLSRHAERLDAQGLHFLERIRENTRQMGELIDDLLSLARVTRAEIRSEPVDLAPRAHQVVERLRQRHPDRVVDVEIDDQVPCVGDSRLLGIVLENLVENAWKFTSRTPAACIRIGTKAGEGGEQVVYVADNGAGFDMAYADKLFNAFHRLHAVTEFEGTGIGLATVHRIVTRHGGRVWAEARPGLGAVFQFTLSGAKHEEQQDPAGGGQPGSPGTHPDDAGREQCPQ